MGEKTQQKTGVQTREIAENRIRAMKGAENERKFILSFSSEEPYERYYGTEILSHDENAVDLRRLNEIGCVLYNHCRDAVIGKINRAWVENGRGYAEIEFDEDEESEKIYQKVKSGTLKGVSVGYRVSVWEEIVKGGKSEDGRFEGPASIAKRWQPFEISIVSVPADGTVGVGREMEREEQECSGNNGRSLSFYEWQLKINQNNMN